MLRDLDLILVKCEDGFNYDWQDQHGATMCCGWFKTQNEANARDAAVRHLVGDDQFNADRYFMECRTELESDTADFALFEAQLCHLAGFNGLAETFVGIARFRKQEETDDH